MATFTNQAMLDYNGVTINSNVVYGEIDEPLEVEKLALQDTYKKGDKISFNVLLRNTGDTDLSGLQFTDNLGAFSFGTMTLVPYDYVVNSLQIVVNGSVVTDYTLEDTDPLQISGIDIPANGNAVVMYEAYVNDYAPLSTGSTIDNEASVSGSLLVDPVSDTLSLVVDDSPDLELDKALTPNTTGAEYRLTYTFTIRNYGSAVTTETNLKFRDRFKPKLNAPTVMLNGMPVPEDQYGYDMSGEFYINEGYLTVPAAEITRDPATGKVNIVPGEATLVISGTL